MGSLYKYEDFRRSGGIILKYQGASLICGDLLIIPGYFLKSCDLELFRKFLKSLENFVNFNCLPGLDGNGLDYSSNSLSATKSHRSNGNLHIYHEAPVITDGLTFNDVKSN